MQTPKRPTTVHKNAVFGKVEPVQWIESPINADPIVINGNSLDYGTPTTIHQRRGAISRQIIYSGDVAIEFTLSELRPSVNGTFYGSWVNAIAVGLSNGDLGNDENSIRWGVVHAWSNATSLVSSPTYAQAQVPETGLQVREQSLVKAGIVGSKLGSKVRIAAENGFVNYYLDGERFYTSETPVTYPLIADVSMMGSGARIDNAMLIRGGAPVLHGAIKGFWEESMPRGIGSYLKGYDIRQIVQAPATNGIYGSSNVQVTTTMGGVLDIYLRSWLRVLSPRSQVLAISQVRGLERYQANIGGKVVIYSSGSTYRRDAVNADSSNDRENPLGQIFWGTLQGDYFTTPNDYPIRAEIPEVTTIWLDTQPLPSNFIPSGGVHPPPGANYYSGAYVNPLEAHYVVGLDLRKGLVFPNLPGALSCNAGGNVSQLTLIELIPR